MKIICIGQNYKEHIKELNSDYPDEPVFFLKPESAVLRNNVFFLPEFSNDIQHEIEIVIRINRLGKHINAKFAHRYYDAIAVGLDLTARDLQRKCKEKGLPWEIAKAFDGSAVLSEFIPISEFANLNSIGFSLNKNGETVQNGNTSDMIFGFDKIVEYVSTFMTLKIGDIILTGTPSGVSKLNREDQLCCYLQGREMLNLTIK
jgi:2-keto-4-pentenoate hydratase/2-oxohepta-3-ene-1,7-dioic acid hydratase in catechol pathway